VRARLPESKIAAQHCDACVAKGLGESDEQRRVGVRAGSVRQDQAVAAGVGGAMQVALNGSFRDFGGAAHSPQIKPCVTISPGMTWCFVANKAG
jgi:hypothetical protein